MADQVRVTTTGADVAVTEATIQQFQAGLHGALLRPGNADYDVARQVFNGMINKRPALIVRCASAADVVHTITFVRSHDLLMAVRSGGHSVAGKSVCDGGVLIDLSTMKGMQVDPTRRIARAQPGLRLGEFDRDTQAFGLATPLGIMSETSIAVLTLGGGIGWLS
jgi:FAD/FMN-containing dehydrogenase